MELTVITPYKRLSFEIAWLEIETTVGNFVIQPGSAPTVLLLKSGHPTTFCLKNGKQETIDIKAGGLVEITRQGAMIILNE